MSTCDEDRITEDFDRYIAANPEFMRLFDRFALEMIRAGARHGSAALIFERIRWELSVARQDAAVRINNNFRSRASRLWERRRPEHAGFFRKRRLAGASANSTRTASDFYAEAAE